MHVTERCPGPRYIQELPNELVIRQPELESAQLPAKARNSVVLPEPSNPVIVTQGAHDSFTGAAACVGSRTPAHRDNDESLTIRLDPSELLCPERSTRCEHSTVSDNA